MRWKKLVDGMLSVSYTCPEGRFVNDLPCNGGRLAQGTPDLMKRLRDAIAIRGQRLCTVVSSIRRRVSGGAPFPFQKNGSSLVQYRG
jgi:hypothetical protein